MKIRYTIYSKILISIFAFVAIFILRFGLKYNFEPIGMLLFPSLLLFLYNRNGLKRYYIQSNSNNNCIYILGTFQLYRYNIIIFRRINSLSVFNDYQIHFKKVIFPYQVVFIAKIEIYNRLINIIIKYSNIALYIYENTTFYNQGIHTIFNAILQLSNV